MKSIKDMTDKERFEYVSTQYLELYDTHTALLQKFEELLKQAAPILKGDGTPDAVKIKKLIDKRIKLRLGGE
jgi:hypothetical protein